MEKINAQQIFFKHIKSLLPSHLSLADEVAEVLSVSNDSAYRRIRGETQISLEEIKELCLRFNISLDQLLNIDSNSFVFSGSLINGSDYNYLKWLQNALAVIKDVKNYQPNHIAYVAKDFPFYYYFLIPEIAAFKSFFFMKSILFYDEWKTKKFSIQDDFSEYDKVWREIIETYISISGTEIWTIENITSTIRQIEFYYLTGVFKSRDDVAALIEKINEMLDHIQTQAEHGQKLYLHQKPTETSDITYNLYINELILGDNMQIMQKGNNYYTYLNHTTLNYLTTVNERFNNHMKRSMDIVVQKSIPISVVNERERIIFFNKLKDKLNVARQKILS